MKHLEGYLSLARRTALVVATLQIAACGSSHDDSAGSPPSFQGGEAPPALDGSGAPDPDTSATTPDMPGSPDSTASSTGVPEAIDPVGLVGAAGSAGTDGTPAMGGAPAVGATPPPLNGKFVGNISTRGQIRADFPTFWNQFSPENEGKWGTVQPNEGTFNWGALDKEYAFAQANNIVFKEHNFIWGAQQPNWVNNGNAQTAVQTWMTEFCKRYPNVKVIDVVNEPPPHTTPKYIDGLGGTGASGFDWIANAFKMARQACPNALLLLNDYNNIELAGDNNHNIDIVNRIKAAGAPIDGIGAQSHGLANAKSANVKTLIDNITTKTGLPVYITEFDLNIADDQKQMAVMQDLFTMFWNDPNVKGVTLWGYIVGSTWETNSGLMQANGQMRPAMSWLTNFLAQQK